MGLRWQKGSQKCSDKGDSERGGVPERTQQAEIRPFVDYNPIACACTLLLCFPFRATGRKVQDH